MPLTNDDIRQFMSLLTEIRDNLKPTKAVELEKSKHKGGRPKGSKNVKRTSKR